MEERTREKKIKEMEKERRKKGSEEGRKELRNQGKKESRKEGKKKQHVAKCLLILYSKSHIKKFWKYCSVTSIMSTI